MFDTEFYLSYLKYIKPTVTRTKIKTVEVLNTQMIGPMMPTASSTTTSSSLHGNICVLCRQVVSGACGCSVLSQTATKFDPYADFHNNWSESRSKRRRRSRRRNHDATATTFPSELASAQHCGCQNNQRHQEHQPQQHEPQQQHHVANVAHACCCQHRSRSSSNSNKRGRNSSSSSNSTNDNNQKVTAATANCQCKNNNNNNNHTYTYKQRLQKKQQHKHNTNNNIDSNCFNILGNLQFVLMFKQMLMQYCCNLFERPRKQHQQQQQRQQQHRLQENEIKSYQHYRNYHWRQSSIAFTIITLLTLQAATTLAQQQQDNKFSDSLKSHVYNSNTIGVNSDSNSIDNSNSLRSSYSDSIRNINVKHKDGIKLANKEMPCKSMDIRNTIFNLRRLANCTVIEGFVLITLINDADKLNTTYPLLTEVTGYVLVYRVANLISLAQIFPNLSVIRGNILFESYALVAYSNRDLQEIGLTNLRAISNGGVRFEKNDYLCFAKTVNWQKIVSKNAKESDIVIKNNRLDAECARCPGDDGDGFGTVITDKSDVNACQEQTDGNRYCWNNKDCQTFCPKECPYNCIDAKTCCNESCLGSCTLPHVGSCIACRNVSIDGGICVDQCAEGYFLYEQRCITAEMCTKLGKKYVDSSESELVHYNGKCTTSCDAGYSKTNNTCTSCNGVCEKECQGGLIDSALRAREFQGCTFIGQNGLTISMKRGGQHNLDALEIGFRAVHTINSFLRVHLTYGLTSLDFFKSLRRINGNETFEGRYVLYVLENRDLEGIWAENQTVQINGSVFFHFNPKLCIETIDKLRPMLPNKPLKFSKNEVAEDSNGEKGKCNTRWLNVEFFYTETYYITFAINKTIVNYDDDRSFIGYQFYFTPDPHGNVTRDSYMPCSDNWSVSPPVKSNLIRVGALEPYTNYAFYVRTLTISSEKRNYQSDIIRGRTLPATPTSVTNTQAIATDSSEILVSWGPPMVANGKLEKYQIRVELAGRDPSLEHNRNFCRDPIPNAALIDEASSPNEKTIKKKPEPDCKCDVSGRPTYDQQEVDETIHEEVEFENALQNYIYVAVNRPKEPKKQNNTNPDPLKQNNTITKDRRRRYIEVDEMDGHMDSVLMRHVRSINDPQTVNQDQNSTNFNVIDSWSNKTILDSSGKYYILYSHEVDVNQTSFRFKGLRHFSLYTITIRVCREKDPREKISDKPQCSTEVSWLKRTLKRKHVDKASNLTGNLLDTNLNTTRGSVRLNWDPPTDPNSAIVSFMIIYERQEPNAVPEKRCITVQDYRNQSGYIVTNLNEGKYSFRIQANSLAGEGELTDFVYVTVPPQRLSVLTIIASAVGVILVIGGIVTGSYFCFKGKKTPQDLIINTEVNPFYASLQYVPDDWEVPRERIIQLGPLGQGSFGMVYEGILKAQNNDEDTPCAIKTVNENATDRERTNFLSEASVMKQFDTYHVVRLLGVCSRGQPALVVMELMKKGDLKSYLRAHRPDEREDVLAVYQQRIGLTPSSGGTLGAVQPPPYSRIFQMAIEIADGMAYLAAKKFVHRDLAARNCMVAADLTVKIGDFGMTRDIYETDYYRKGTKGLLPVRWMPPESLRDGVYASSSDVFSYGVVLWEMATLASQPYQGLSNEQVLRYVIDGGIMERPDNCPELLHKLMHRCWHHRPTARPSFLDIIAYLEHLSDPHFKEVAFYYSDAGVQYREKERKERSNHLDIFAGGQLDADVDGEDATTPLRVGEYQDYKSNMNHNTSLEQPAESPIALVDDQATTHSPISLLSGFIVSSTPDALSTLPTAGGSHMEDAAYVQADANATLTADGERGYELYDPSPNFGELPRHCRLSGEQHLIPKTKRGGANIVPSMSSSMPDEVIGGGSGGGGAVAAGGGIISTSLQPSTASAASSNTSSSRQQSFKRVMADTFRNRVLSRFSHKRSGSNVSHKSNISNAPSNSSNTNLTSHPAGMAMVNMGPNLGTIESGGSGSAGSYTGTPRFYTPTATTPSGGGNGNGSTTIISDNPNYKVLDESVNSADPVNSMWSQQLTTSSLNPNYEMMQPPPTTTTTDTEAQPFSLLSDNPNYVMMSEPPIGSGQGPIFTSDNPNYAAMLAPTQVQQSSSDEDENDEDDDDDEDADEHTEHIKMERMPLSRPKQQQQRTRIKSQQQLQQPRSRSVSQTRKAETPTPTATAAAAAAATTGNTSNILKENWLRQASTPRPPLPNGFTGREA